MRIAGIAISLVSLAAVVWWASGQEAPTFPDQAAEWGWLGAGLGAVALAMAVRGERSFRILVDDGAEPTRADTYALTAVNYMGNTVLPARGGDAIRAYLQAPRAATTIRNVVGAMVAERLLDAAMLISLFVVVAYFLLDGIDAPGPARLALVAAGLAVAALVLLVLVHRARDHPRLRAALDWLAPVGGATRSLRGRHAAAMIGVTAAIWACETLAYLFVAHATDLQMDLLEALYMVTLASVFVLIPSGPGYLGTYDAAIIFGVDAIGGSGSQAISYLLMMRFVLLVPVTLVGVVLMIVRYGGLRELRRADGAVGA